jgi:hypothetical protein
VFDCLSILLGKITFSILVNRFACFSSCLDIFLPFVENYGFHKVIFIKTSQ